MKKLLLSILALIIMSTMLLGSTAPIAAAAVTSSSETNSTDVPISERYHVIENGYRDKYDLQEGVFGHQSSQQVNKNAVYYYSDGYFEDAPSVYNPSLSTMSLAFSIATFNAMHTEFDKSLPNGQYSNLFRHAKVLLSDLGIKEKDIYLNDSFGCRPTEDSIGMIMGAKEISINNEEYILIPIAVRGGDYEAEWSSNVTLGESGESLGFSNSATKVVDEINNYISANTSFDIASALNEGRVKFWIVGYSRGGAVANITAKRLTDTYAKNGNSIYAYTFEAPNGGVDSAEIKEDWTYNGVYANIHNIINSADLVPKIPPKQMGFKRYGVDHYNPGTDAGEIITTTYTTPTGITVTTYADNMPYTVGDENYNQRRANMLKYLENIDKNIVFSDEFEVGKINFLKALSGGELFVPVENAQNVSSAEWLDTFINDLLNWAANGTYSNGNLNNGGYNSDYRDFYTSNSNFAGKEYVTLENSLQYILKFAFTHYENKEFSNAVAYRFISLLFDYATLLDLYLNVIQKWDELSKSKQNQYLDQIWNALTTEMEYSDGTEVKKITDFADPEDQELLKNSVYTVSAFLFLFISKDQNTSPSFDGISEKQVHIVTFAANVNTILQGHYPEICMAWLNTYDENYSTEKEGAKYSNTAINLVNDVNNAPPTIEVNIVVDDTQSTVSLSTIINLNRGVDTNSTDNGSAIYYALYENGKMVGNWTLYKSPIVIDTTQNTQYTLKAFAVRFEERGKEITLSDKQIRTNEKSPEDEGDNGISEETQETVALKPLEERMTLIASIISGSLVIIGLAVLLITKKRKK